MPRRSVDAMMMHTIARHGLRSRCGPSDVALALDCSQANNSDLAYFAMAFFVKSAGADAKSNPRKLALGGFWMVIAKASTYR